MADPVRIWCGSDTPPRGTGKGFKRAIQLNSRPIGGNVKLEIENISTPLAQDVPDIALDLMEIGSYVYCGDQTILRGGQTWPKNGQGWYRHIVFEIPVRCPEVWEDPQVKECLIETLGFLSDDHFEFKFRKLAQDYPWKLHFDFKEDEPWFKADEVVLFSGGLDSLAGVVEEVLTQNHRVLLVSHRPVAKIAKRQIDLVNELKQVFGRSDAILHIPVWVNKAKGLTKDGNQRTRSFLYAAPLCANISETKSDCCFLGGWRMFCERYWSQRIGWRVDPAVGR